MCPTPVIFVTNYRHSLFFLNISEFHKIQNTPSPVGPRDPKIAQMRRKSRDFQKSEISTPLRGNFQKVQRRARVHPRGNPELRVNWGVFSETRVLPHGSLGNPACPTYLKQQSTKARYIGYGRCLSLLPLQAYQSPRKYQSTHRFRHIF